jgi:hypothetical protein
MFEKLLKQEEKSFVEYECQVSAWDFLINVSFMKKKTVFFLYLYLGIWRMYGAHNS